MIHLSEVDHTLIFTSLFLSISMFVWRTLKAYVAFGALVCACVFVALDGHFWIGELLLPHGRNPQIATVALLMLVSAATLVALALKRWRTLDRIMIFFAGVSVLATFGLFHYVLVQQIMPAWAKDAAWGNSYLLPSAKAEFKVRCAGAGLTCWTASDIDQRNMPSAYQQQVEGLYRFYQEAKPTTEVGHGFGVFNDLGEDGVAVVLYHQDRSDVRVIVDAKAGKRLHAKIRDSFYLLASFAHGIWVFGSLLLIALHRMRFRRMPRAH